MTEEVQETEKVEEKKVEEVKVSPTEQSARDQGWVSQEEWVADGKDPEQWRPAKEFVDRGELYKSIHQTKRELKQTQAALTALQKHHLYVFENAHKQALDELKREKRQALKNEDIQKVVEVEEKIEELTEQQKTEKEAFVRNQVATVPQGGVHPDFAAWQETNTWYQDDEELREYADFKGIKYTQKNPGVDPKEVLAYVEKQVKKQFPEKFGTRKAAPNPVTKVDKTSSSNRKAVDGFELSETEEAIMKDLVQSGVMTREKYISDLKKIKDR